MPKYFRIFPVQCVLFLRKILYLAGFNSNHGQRNILVDTGHVMEYFDFDFRVEPVKMHGLNSIVWTVFAVGYGELKNEFVFKFNRL